jgi:hypothetical protein
MAVYIYPGGTFVDWAELASNKVRKHGSGCS